MAATTYTAVLKNVDELLARELYETLENAR